jgi:hypothetical protein
MMMAQHMPQVALNRQMNAVAMHASPNLVEPSFVGPHEPQLVTETSHVLTNAAPHNSNANTAGPAFSSIGGAITVEPAPVPPAREQLRSSAPASAGGRWSA